jgi:formate hydrogenlyase subunit 6/NADH:ubiquinone oxidoreductase subunit I
MNIFQVILENLNQAPLTLRYPQRAAAAEGFRGLVQNDPARCIGCGTCAYVCSSGAVTVTSEDKFYEWAYDPGKCTFCGRCVDYCPVDALAQQNERPPLYLKRDELVQALRLDYPLCPLCGLPAQPVNAQVLLRAFGELSPEILAWSRLCPHCRQEQRQPELERMLSGQIRSF